MIERHTCASVVKHQDIKRSNEQQLDMAVRSNFFCQWECSSRFQGNIIERMYLGLVGLSQTLYPSLSHSASLSLYLSIFCPLTHTLYSTDNKQVIRKWQSLQSHWRLFPH